MALVATREGFAVVLEAALPGRETLNIGVLLADPSSDELYVRLRRDWASISDDPEDIELLKALADDLELKSRELGAEALVGWLEDSLSNTIRISDRRAVIVEDFSLALDRLYHQNVQARVIPFQTHLPRYSLRVAAGKFRENAEVTEDGWEETPEDLRLTPDMFVARIAGHSMEPLIPDGSLCVFRSGVVGSRNGRLVLVEDRQTSGNNRHTVKRYRSEKAPASSSSLGSGDEWRHSRIRLESLNPDYPSWDLEVEEERFQILAEFVRVLSTDSPEA
ncbi:MAG: DUF3037 domain-containing protein [Bryobacteraceae bacterium]